MTNKIALDKSKTALVIIDMQNSYCHPEGSIGRNGYDNKMMIEAVPKVKELVEACRENGILDIWVTQNHYNDDQTRFNRLITPHTHRWAAGPPAVKGSWESEVVDELKVFIDEDTEVVKKHRFSAFFDTRIDTLLRMKGIETLIVCGVATTHCVETTVRDAYQRDYNVIVGEEAVGAMSLEDHEASLRLINKTFGLVLNNRDLVTLIEGKELELKLETEPVVKG